MKRKLAMLLLSLTFCMTIRIPSYASDAGGWDEEKGYFKTAADYEKHLAETQNLYSNYAMSAKSTKSEVKHTGKREKEVINGNTHSRAHGWTTWAGVRHYTRARMTAWWDADNVYTDSGRVWGYDGTEAISPWWKAVRGATSKARTFYGN